MTIYMHSMYAHSVRVYVYFPCIFIGEPLEIIVVILNKYV